MQLLCQVNQRYLTNISLGFSWLHLQCHLIQNSNCHMGGLPWNVDKAHNHGKGIITYVRHPKVKWTWTNNLRCKGWDHTFFLNFSHHIRAFQPLFGNEMGIIHAHHIVAKLNAIITNFQQKTKVGNLMPHIKPSSPKMFFVQVFVTTLTLGSQPMQGAWKDEGWECNLGITFTFLKVRKSL